ncbi:MAG: DNA repair protein RadA [Acidimicrobiales bacterium]
MTRPSRHHVCSACGATSPKWAGRCPGCGEWNTLVETVSPRDIPRSTGGIHLGGSSRSGHRPGGPGQAAGEWPSPGVVSPGDLPGALVGPVPLPSVDAEGAKPFATGLLELDRVLSGGLVPGSVTLLGGEPGIGKSTLVLQAVACAARRGARSLIIAAEESAEQVRRRAERLGALPEECYLFSTSDLLASIEAADQVRPALLVIDSIQALRDGAISSPAGSTNQVRECAQLLAQYAKATGVATVLIGHVTKDGALAGPRTLEHLVDTVLSFEGDRHHAMRALVATKHRYGSSGELGLFEMCEEGLRSLEDPSALLLGDRRPGAAGSLACPVVEGRRPLVVEVQSLLAMSRNPSPRRVVQGVSAARVALLLAVLERCCGARVGGADVFVSTVGAIKVTEPAADLAIALAVMSSLRGIALPHDTVVFGEIGLAGEVRQVARPDRRLAESARLGFNNAIVPQATPEGPSGMGLTRVRSVAEAVELLGLSGPVVGDRPVSCDPGPQDSRAFGDLDRGRHLLVLAPIEDEAPGLPRSASGRSRSDWGGGL